MSEITPSASAGLERSRRSVGGYAVYVFYVLFAINFLNYLDRFILTGASNAVAQELHFGIDGIGFLASAFIVLFTFSAIPFGIWADRTRRKNVSAICVAIWSIATAFTALAGNFLTLLVSRMILGVGEAGYSPASSALMADYFSRARRARILSWWATAALIGVMIGIIIGGVVAGLGAGKWRWAFIFTGIPGLLLALLAWRLREPRRNQADEEAGEDLVAAEGDEMAAPVIVPQKVLAQFGMLLRIKSLRVLIVMQIFSSFVSTASIVYLPTLFHQNDSFGLSLAAAGLFTGIGVALAGISGAVIGGYLSDWLNRRYPGARVLICGLGFLVGAPSYLLSVIVGLGTHNIFFYSIFFFSTTLLLNIYLGPGGAAIQDIIPSSLRASAVATSLFIVNLVGNAFAPALVGVLALALDPTHGQHFAHNVAGVDLSLALSYTCPPALVVAGLIGILGSRWVKSDMLAAQRAEKTTQATPVA